jgi:hypothetical protein
MPIMRHFVSVDGVRRNGQGSSRLIYAGRQRGIAESVRDNLVAAILDLGLPLTVEHDDGVRVITLPITKKENQRGA